MRLTLTKLRSGHARILVGVPVYSGDGHALDEEDGTRHCRQRVDGARLCARGFEQLSSTVTTTAAAACGDDVSGDSGFDEHNCIWFRRKVEQES